MIEKENESFRPVIRKIFEDTQGRLGAKKIRVIMMTRGYTISPERISRIMKEMGLACTSAQKASDIILHPKIDILPQLRTSEVKQSFSAPGCPYDNAVAEAFFRTLKAEEVSRRQYRSGAELRASIGEYIDFFNHIRPHQKFQYRSSDQVKADYNA